MELQTGGRYAKSCYLLVTGTAYWALDAELTRAAAAQLAAQHEIPILGIKLDVVGTQKETTFPRLRSASALS
jgi:hypothetical protein